jgi:histone acetyltransferase MYST1
VDRQRLSYGVEGLAFYALCECDQSGARIVAYFSRELVSDKILACIVVLPPFEGRGHGRFLVSLAYELAKRRNAIGGPERPLSALGELAFKSYWRDTVLELLRTQADRPQTLEGIEATTGITQREVAMVLAELRLVVPAESGYELRFDRKRLAEEIGKRDAGKPKTDVDPRLCIWTREPVEEDEAE